MRSTNPIVSVLVLAILALLFLILFGRKEQPAQ